jgi:hypothetical protein
MLEVESTATGESTLADFSADLTATGDGTGGTAGVDATTVAIAEDDTQALATTTLWSSTTVQDDDGSISGVDTYTYGLATGDTVYSTSSTDSFAIDTEGADITYARVTSYASGEDYHDSEAYVDPYGDVTGGGGMDIDTDTFSMAIDTGVAIDLA